MASVFGCHCRKKPQQFLLHMHVCPLLVQSTMGQYCLIWRVKLAGRALLLPHPVQDQKKKKMFSNAARSNSFGQVSVPQLPISVSFTTEREQEQRELSLSLCQTLSLNYSLSLLPVAFESACPFIEDFFFKQSLDSNPLCFPRVSSKFQCS